LCPGIKVEGWKHVDNESRELVNEIMLTRDQSGASGDILWHSKPLMANHAGIADALAHDVYREPALMPPYPWLDKNVRPYRPVLTVHQGRHEMKVRWSEGTNDIWQWVVQKKINGHWTTEILPGSHAKEILIKDQESSRPEAIALSAVNRYGGMSEPAVFNTLHLEK
jgi:hypothetical protein